MVEFIIPGIVNNTGALVVNRVMLAVVWLRDMFTKSVISPVNIP